MDGSKITLAADDIVAGFRKSWMWSALAMQDIRLRYRGSMLGPFWLTISTIVMIVAMGFVYSHIFKIELRTYFPYLTIGLVVWQFISTVINEGCNAFLAMQSIIQQVRLPLSLYVYRLVYRNVIVFGHTFAIVPIVLLFYGGVSLSLELLLVLPGFVLLLINCVWIGILLGMLSARYRDVPSIVSNFVQVLFFVTPVFWTVDALGPWQWLAELNPLFAAIDVIRAPLLGKSPALMSWIVLLIVTIVGSVVSFAFFARFRQRIAYWV